MIFTNQQLALCLQCLPALAAQWGDHLRAAMAHYQIDTRQRVAMFLAQIGHESRGLAVLSENLNYRAEALVTIFGRHRITTVQADKYGRTADHPADPEALANILYGGDWGRENLGNTEPDDGWRYRGRGPKQITGRANYRSMAAHVPDAPDFERSPELLTEPKWGAWSAAAFWDMKKLNGPADRNDILAVTKAINGGTLGLDDRKARYSVALSVLV